jgi:hypothetical protein
MPRKEKHGGAVSQPYGFYVAELLKSQNEKRRAGVGSWRGPQTLDGPLEIQLSQHSQQALEGVDYTSDGGGGSSDGNIDESCESGGSSISISSESDSKPQKIEDPETQRMLTTARSLWITRVGVLCKGVSYEENVARREGMRQGVDVEI